MTKIYIDANLPPQIADALNLLESTTGEGFVVIPIERAFSRAVTDEDWIPAIGAERGVVLTQDTQIHKNKAQRRLYEQHGVGVFFIPQPTKKRRYRYWELVEQIVKHWQEIRVRCTDQRPFAFEILETKSKLKSM